MDGLNLEDILIDWHLYLNRVVQSVVKTTAINWSPAILKKYNLYMLYNN
jgi:hypothetical protein